MNQAIHCQVPIFLLDGNNNTSTGRIMWEMWYQTIFPVIPLQKWIKWLIFFSDWNSVHFHRKNHRVVYHVTTSLWTSCRSESSKSLSTWFLPLAEFDQADNWYFMSDFLYLIFTGTSSLTWSTLGKGNKMPELFLLQSQYFPHPQYLAQLSWGQG